MARIFANSYELISEIFREVWEMGTIVYPKSMQNKVIEGNDEFSTREITNYSYTLVNLTKQEFLFWADPRAKAWADAEFEERVMDPMYFTNPGKAWKLRENIWKEFLNKDGKFDYTYNERIMKTLPFVIMELRRNPDTRQAIVPIFDDNDINGLGGSFRIPCSIYYQFMIRRGRLNIIYNQRSADVVTHFGNDVYLAWRLMEYIADRVGVKTGHLFHNIGSLHAYKKDWPILKRCIDDIKI